MKKYNYFKIIPLVAAGLFGVGGILAVNLTSNGFKEVRAEISGEGTEDNPYLLGSWSDLDWFRGQVNNYSRTGICAKLTNDINAYNWESISPASSSKYTGIFDGNNHTINFSVSSETYHGLFGWVAGGTIKNLTTTGSIEATNNATNNVGAIVGNLDDNGKVINCANYATISGNSYWTGGIVGKIHAPDMSMNERSTIRECFNKGDLSSSKGYTGGIVGYSTGLVENCYNAGNITVTVSGTNANTGGIAAYVYNWSNNIYSETRNNFNYGNITISSGSTTYRGGVIGYTNNGGQIANNYYLAGTCVGGISGSDAAGKAVSLSAANFKLTSSFNDYDFVNIWKMGKNYPVFINNADPSAEIPILPGDGTVDNPYILSTTYALERFRDIVNGINGETKNSSACAVLTSDMNLHGSESNQWTPINDYCGIFDGNGHEITNIYIKSSANHVGFFTNNQANSVIKYLDVDGTVISTFDEMADSFIGGLTSNNLGTILSCASSINVTSIQLAGGVAGINQGVIYKSVNYGNVTCTYGAGGIAGMNKTASGHAKIQNCYNSGNVTSTTAYAAGIVPESTMSGYNWSVIQNCYNYGTISAASGYRDSAIICYYDNSHSTFNNNYYLNTKSTYGIGNEASKAGKVAALTSEQFKDKSSFNCWDFNNTWKLDKWDDCPMIADFMIGKDYVVNPENSTIVSGDGWSYDYSTNTITLTDFSYTGIGHDYKYNSSNGAIIYTGDSPLNIVLNGENTIVNSKDNEEAACIFTCSPINISGEGSLNLSLSEETRVSYGIKSGGLLTVNSGTINIVNGNSTENSYGISASSYGGMIVNGGTIDIDASQSTCANAAGIYAWGNVNDNNHGLVINEGVDSFTVKARKYALGGGQVLVGLTGTGWTDVAGSEGETVIEASETPYEKEAFTTLKKVEFISATSINIEISDKSINYNEDAPTYEYVAKLGDEEITDQTLLAAIKEHVTLSSTYTKGNDAGSYDIINSNAKADEKFVVGEETYKLNNIKGSLTVNKINPVVTAPTAKNPHYTGDSLILIEEGSTTGGTLLYSLDGVNYSSSLPEATVVGEYTIYYKVVGNTNYNDVEAASIKANIAENDKTSLNYVIGLVEGYDNTIKEDYPTIAAELELAIADAKSVSTNLNVTEGEIDEAISNLGVALGNAQVGVVETLIDDIGEVSYTQESLAKIEKASNAFEELSKDLQEKVSNYDKLENAAIKYVEGAIDDIGTVEYTDECKAKIDTAQSLFDKLDSSAQDKVSNKDTLAAAVETYKELDDAAKAKEVEDLISAIGTVEYTDTCKGKIDAARDAYENLTTDQKGLVKPLKLSDLINAENAYTKLKADHEAANAVIAKIDAIGTVEYTDTCKGKIDAARAAYNNLSADQKELISAQKLSDLTNAEVTYAKLKADHDAADAVKALIDAIGDVKLTDDCKAKIDAANAAYEKLTEAQKELVTNKKVLFDAIELYNTLAHQPEVNDSGVAVEGKDGELIPVNVNIKVELKTTVKAEQGSVEYEKIQEMLAYNEKISNVFDVKLVRTVAGVETEIQPSDIKEGMIIVVEITLPDGLLIEGLKVLHIHNENDITFVENFTITGNKLTFETDRLSEFAFVTIDPNARQGLPGWAIALIIVGGLLLLCCGCLLVLFIFFPRFYIDHSQKKEVRRAIYIKKHFDEVLLLNTHCKFVRRKDVDVFKSKEEAEASIK